MGGFHPNRGQLLRKALSLSQQPHGPAAGDSQPLPQIEHSAVLLLILDTDKTIHFDDFPKKAIQVEAN